MSVLHERGTRPMCRWHHASCAVLATPKISTSNPSEVKYPLGTHELAAACDWCSSSRAFTPTTARRDATMLGAASAEMHIDRCNIVIQS